MTTSMAKTDAIREQKLMELIGVLAAIHDVVKRLSLKLEVLERGSKTECGGKAAH